MLTFLIREKWNVKYETQPVTLTLDVPVDNAVLMEDINGCSDLFTVEPDDMFLQTQSGHLLQSSFITVLHEDVHLLLQVSASTITPRCFCMYHETPGMRWAASYPMELHSKVSHEIWVFNAFKDFQLVCRLLDCFVVVWLESDLVIEIEQMCATLSVRRLEPLSECYWIHRAGLHTSFMAISSPVSTLMQVYTFPYWPSPVFPHTHKHSITVCMRVK